MAKRGIEKIRGFEDFPCLEVLWMQENDITSLNHLDNNFRLKSLYLSGNRISTLEGSSLKNLPNLEVLFLANNQITDLGIQLREVQQLPFLQQLELLGNPVAEETNYRQQVIHRIPSLKVLDRHVITSLERVLAAQMARHEGWDVKPEAPPPRGRQFRTVEGRSEHQDENARNPRCQSRSTNMEKTHLFWRYVRATTCSPSKVST